MVHRSGLSFLSGLPGMWLMGAAGVGIERAPSREITPMEMGLSFVASGRRRGMFLLMPTRRHNPYRGAHRIAQVSRP